MNEAGRRLNLTGNSVRRAMIKMGTPLIKLNPRAYAVTIQDFDEFKKKKRGRGRPSIQSAI